MNNKSQITLLVNGRKMYTRNVGAHKKYGFAVVNAFNPTRILACSTDGKFDARLTARGEDYFGVVCPVTWTDNRHAVAEMIMTADDLNIATTKMQEWIANATDKGRHGAADSLTHDLGVVMDLWGDAIEAGNTVDAPEVEEVVEAPKAKKAKKAKVSTETPEKMMQRFAGQCREMIRKIGYAEAMTLMRMNENAAAE